MTKIKNKPYYILKDDKPVREDDPIKWARWFENSIMTRERVLGQASLKNGYFISTVFLGLDHAFGLSPRPVLFETWIRDQVWGKDYYERFETYEDAERDFNEKLKEYRSKKLWRVPFIVFLRWLNEKLQKYT